MKRLMLALMAVCVVAVGAVAQGDQIPLIGSKAPSFTAISTNGKITFPDDYGHSWKILFSHPADFTPVCSSELLEMANLQPEFKKLGVQVAVISKDDVKMHTLWKQYLEDLDYKNYGKNKIEFPLIDDSNLKASKKYGMLHYPTSTNRDIRGVFIIDGDNIVRAINFYPLQVGRNMQEIIRLVQALQTTEEALVYTPANWEKGDDVIIPYYPFDKAESEIDPEDLQNYYKVGNRVWFKRVAEEANK